MKQHLKIMLSVIFILLFGSIIIFANSNIRDITIDNTTYVPMELNDIPGTNKLYLAWQIDEMLKNLKPETIEYKYPCFIIPLGHSISIKDGDTVDDFWTDFEIKATTNNFENISARIDNLRFTDGICYVISSICAKEREFAYANCGYDEGARMYYKCAETSPQSRRCVEKFNYMDLTLLSIFNKINNTLNHTYDFYVVDARVVPSLDNIVVSNNNERIKISEDVVKKYLYRENPSLRWVYTRFNASGRYESDENGEIIWHDIEPEWYTVRKFFTNDETND